MKSLADNTLPPAWVVEALNPIHSRKQEQASSGEAGRPFKVEADPLKEGSSRPDAGSSSKTSWPDVALSTTDDVELLVCTSSKARLVSACVADAAHLSALDFQSATTRVFGQIREALLHGGEWYPLRFWNFIPDIHASLGKDLDRYMVFNAARFEAFACWYGGVERFGHSVATASGLGHRGENLHVHLLAGRTPGRHVENPRQIASYHYSRRFGPLPPCFARATLARLGASDRPLLLIGGTSSVRGEDSVRTGDVVKQTQETLKNLSTLIAAAVCQQNASDHAPEVPDEALPGLRHVRVYARHSEDVEAILSVLLDNAPHLKTTEIEVLQADICRPELLVEIEGTAELEASA